MSEVAPETPVAEVQKEEPAAPPAGGAKGKGEDKGGKKKGRKAFDLKTPKGTVDYDPWQMAIREKVFGIVTSCFKRHGAVTIETPVFELRETLMGKYGEDQKLIYDLADQGGEICSLRYDLTVPFARFMASNRTIKFLKRYHIGRVYRRDQPALTRGRYREFYQCDFDIAGQYDVMVPDAEVLKVATEILDKLEIGPYEIKINHRLVLDGMLEICGVPAEMFRPICSAIDKLDKSPWEEVRAEMVNVKKLDPEVADRIHPFVQLRGNCTALLQSIQANGNFNNSETAKEGLRQLGLLFEYLEAYGISERCVFDLSLARGLDYYTGLIFEATTLDKKVGVGSIAGGGRYDNLIGMFGGEIVPSVGFSVGIERVFTILEKQEKAKKKDDASRIRACPTQVLVISPDKGVVTERMRICAELWAVDIKAEAVNKTDPPMKRQLAYADENQIPLAVIIGKKELEEGVVSVKDLKQRQQITIPRAQMVSTLQAVLSGSALESFGSNPPASS